MGFLTSSTGSYSAVAGGLALTAISLSMPQKNCCSLYSQRLLFQQRNICCDAEEPDVASYLYRHRALLGGAGIGSLHRRDCAKTAG
jgi:hypothetical protein